MKTQELISNILIYGGLATAILWVILKLTGVLHSPPIIESIPVISFSATVGGIINSLKNNKNNLNDLKSDMRGAFREVKEDMSSFRKDVQDIKEKLIRIETKLEVS